ncbi:MAG: hypothetical protein ACK4OO_05270, partial [bacterium]
MTHMVILLFRLIWAILLILGNELYSQELSPPTPQNQANPDTLPKAQLDTILTYSAQRLIFTFSPRVTILEGKAEIRYHDMRLEAHRIEVLWDEDRLIAQSAPNDSLSSESLHQSS